MPETWMYNYCAPLYLKIKGLILTSGETLIAKDSFRFFSHIATQYPGITIICESNGIAFNEKWQRLAADHLFGMHFSMNAVTEHTYLRGVWAQGEAGGAAAFHATQRNIANYCHLLAEKKLLAFAPSLSMVINQDTWAEVEPFVLRALHLHAKSCVFYFDNTEFNVESNEISSPYLMNVVSTLMKIERLLAGRFYINFRLWAPLGVFERIQNDIDGIPLNDIRKEFPDIDVAAANRSVILEYRERERIRKEKGKKAFSFEEDIALTLHETNYLNHKICFAPWGELDLSTNGDLRVCGWHTKSINIKKYIRNGTLDWDRVLNQPLLRLMRKDVLSDSYDYGMKCCPLNPKYKKRYDPLKLYREDFPSCIPDQQE